MSMKMQHPEQLKGSKVNLVTHDVAKARASKPFHKYRCRRLVSQKAAMDEQYSSLALEPGSFNTNKHSSCTKQRRLCLCIEHSVKEI